MRALLALAAAVAVPLNAADKPAPLTPSEIVAAAPKADWLAIAPADLLVMDLSPDAAGKPRRVMIQTMPAPFSQDWGGNIRRLARAHWWDGLSINRVQDNYVVQWGDADGEDKAKAKPLPPGLTTVPESRYLAPLPHPAPPFLPWRDVYAAHVGFTSTGWPFASDGKVWWPVHCYGAVGVGRNVSPDTGSGAELYAVIGHAPRHLDRNIAVVGRVIEGVEHLSSLPRGTGALGFYATPGERVRIEAIRLGSEVPDLPAYEFLVPRSPSFARYAHARANQKDDFFIQPSGGADICNIPVPVRRKAG